MRYATLSTSISDYCATLYLLLHYFESESVFILTLISECANRVLLPTLCAIRLCLFFPLLLLELHISVMHDGSSHLVNAILFLLGEAKDIKSFIEIAKSSLDLDLKRSV